MVGNYPSALWPEGAHRCMIRAALLDGETAVSAFHEWSERTDFDDLDHASFRLLPLLRWNMHRLGLKHPLMPRLGSVCRFLMVETTMKLDVLRKLALALHEMEVPCLLLKGSAIGQRYYPHPALRPMADCDALIPYGLRRRAMKRLFDAGWRAKHDDMSVRHYSYDLWCEPFPQILVELHWRSGVQATRGEDRLAWKASEPLIFRDVPCRVMCIEDEIIHTCRHGFNWNAAAPPMRWLVDCALIIRSRAGRINWQRLAEHAIASEEALCVRRSLDWIRREAGVPVPTGALDALRKRRINRRECRIYALKAKPEKDWDSETLLVAQFLNRELPFWRWPLHPLRVLGYFAGHFGLPDHADIIRYFVYRFWQLATRQGKKRIQTLLAMLAPRLGIRRIFCTKLSPDFTGMLEQPLVLCWARRKIRLEGFACANDGSPHTPLRVTCLGNVLPSSRHAVSRPDIVRSRPDLRNAMQSGFWIIMDLPPGESRLLIEYKGSDEWRPLFGLSIEEIQFLNGTLLPKHFPVPPTRIDFADDASGRFLLSGWSQPEASWRWTDGQKAEMIFGLDEIAPMNLEVRMRPFLVMEKLVLQSMQVSLNGHLIPSLELTGFSPAVYSIPLPREFLKNRNFLVFDLPEAASPSSLGSGADARKLGLQVEWMDFRKNAG